MISFQIIVCPSRCIFKSTVFYNRFSVEQIHVIIEIAMSIIGFDPDTGLFGKCLAHIIETSPAGSIPLIFSTLRLGTEVIDIGEGTVTALAAVEHQGLCCSLKKIGTAVQLFVLIEKTEKSSLRFVKRGIFLKEKSMNYPGQPVYRRD